MDYKGTNVIWQDGMITYKGKVIDTHIYKKQQSLKRKGKSILYALYIRLIDGRHVLKNDTEVTKV